MKADPSPWAKRCGSGSSSTFGLTNPWPERITVDETEARHSAAVPITMPAVTTTASQERQHKSEDIQGDNEQLVQNAL
jgi:hypothetical protein